MSGEKPAKDDIPSETSPTHVPDVREGIQVAGAAQPAMSEVRVQNGDRRADILYAAGA